MTRIATVALALGTVAAAAALLPAPAAATIVLMDNYKGPIDFNITSYESFVDSSGHLTNTLAVGDQNFGAFTVSSITAAADYGPISSGETIWSPGGANGQLVGVFSNILVTRITPLTSTNIQTGNTGGLFGLYNVPNFPHFTQGTTGYANAGCALNTLCYNQITNVAGHTTPILTMDLIPGADNANPLETLQATVTSTTIPTTGSATGWMDITGGSDQAQFGRMVFTTAIGTLADMNLLDSFCLNQAGCGGQGHSTGNWQQVDFGPVGADIPLPEPATLGLLGMGLAGIGIARRRRING